MCTLSDTLVAKNSAGTGSVVPASPPLPPLIGRPSTSCALPWNLALKLMAVTSAWKYVPSSSLMAAGLFATTETSPPAVAEPA